MIKFLITRIAVWASGLTSKDFTQVIIWVNQVNGSGSTSSSKKALVELWISRAFPNVPSWAINLLIELAVALVKRNQSA